MGCSMVLVKTTALSGLMTEMAQGKGMPSTISQELSNTNNCPATRHCKTGQAGVPARKR